MSIPDSSSESKMGGSPGDWTARMRGPFSPLYTCSLFTLPLVFIQREGWLLFHIPIIVSMAVLAEYKNNALAKDYTFYFSILFHVNRFMFVLSSTAHVPKLEWYWKDYHGPCPKMAQKFLKCPHFVWSSEIQLCLCWQTWRKWWGVESSLQRPIWGLFPPPHPLDSLLLCAPGLSTAPPVPLQLLN